MGGDTTSKAPPSRGEQVATGASGEDCGNGVEEEPSAHRCVGLPSSLQPCLEEMLLAVGATEYLLKMQSTSSLEEK